MVTAADLNTLSQATLALYSPDLTLGNFTEHGYRFLSALVPCDLINFGDLNPAAGTLDATSNYQPPDWALAVEGFGSCMAKCPLFRFDPTVNDGKPFFRNDFYTTREFRDLDIYSECFRLLGANNHAAVHVAASDGHIRYFALERGGRVNYTERDRQLLHQAQFHLANALKLATARQRPMLSNDSGIFCLSGFTPRESEVAYWLTQGKTNLEIASITKVKPQTIKAHITAMFNKTGTSNRLALTLLMMELRHSAHTRQVWHRAKASRH
jgi:DNA-binding CsgD family transcriptional regulator